MRVFLCRLKGVTKMTKKNVSGMTAAEKVVYYRAQLAQQESANADVSAIGKTKKKLATAEAAVVAEVSSTSMTLVTQDNSSSEVTNSTAVVVHPPLQGGGTTSGQIVVDPPEDLDEAWVRFCNLQRERRRIKKKSPEALAAHDRLVEIAFLFLAKMEGGDIRLYLEIRKILEEKTVHFSQVHWLGNVMRSAGFDIPRDIHRGIVEYRDAYEGAQFDRALQRRRIQQQQLEARLKKLLAGE